MNHIASYHYSSITPRSNEFFDYTAKRISPANDAEDIQIASILDAITLATEAGIVERTTWVKQFFANNAVFRVFLQELDEYDFRINDRWHAALMKISDRKEEFNFVSNAEIAAGLFDAATKTGQL